MGYPTIQVRISFTANPLGTPTWTDVTDYLVSIPLIRRGRQTELDRIEAGEAIVVLKNTDRRFEPAYPGSPYFPYVRPRRRINIRATWAGVTYDLFTGFIDRWETDWDTANQYTEIRLSCADGFLFLNKARVSGSFGAEFTGYALRSLLTAAGWPVADRVIGAGDYARAFIAARTLTNANPLSEIYSMMDAEQGLVFVNPSGNIVLQGRYYRVNTTRCNTSQATFGDGGGSELPYQSLEPSFDAVRVINDARITATGGTEQIVIDSSSQTEYFINTYSKSGIPFGDGTGVGYTAPDAEALGLAEYLIYTYKDVYPRYPRMTVDGRVNDALWPKMLGLEISDLISLLRRPPLDGTTIPISTSTYVEAVEHRIPVISATVLSWQTTFQLSPPVALSPWLLDSLTRSQLDSTTVLGF